MNDIEIDNREKDCILIWQKSDDANVIIIKRENIQDFINQLQKSLMPTA